MNLFVPNYIQSIKPYIPGKPVEELERELGIKDTVKLASNENPLGPSPKAVDAIGKALLKLNRYPDGSGYYLIKKLAVKFNIDSKNIILGNGSDEIIGMLTNAFLKEGDEVIIPTPSFLIYEIMVKASGAKEIFVPLDKNYAIDLESVKSKINNKTRMIFLNNPNNPTGTVISKIDFDNFIKDIPKEIIIVIDEAYIEFARDLNCLKGIEYVNEDRPIVVLRTFSKIYGLAGLRIGYGIMPEKIVEVLNKIRMPFNANSLAQIGALAALDDEEFFNKTINLVHNGLNWLYTELDKLKICYFPTQTNFFLIDVGREADEVFRQLLNSGIIVRSMKSYGFPNFIRVNVGLYEENKKFINALNKVLKRFLITIDGPAGAGKTTISKILSNKLNYKYIDTGALYRAVALEVKLSGITADNDVELEKICSKLDLKFEINEKGLRLFSNNQDITDNIRTPEISMMASLISARPVVRSFLLALQRSMGEEKGVVFEGRDMGTVVFPEADIKFFLDGSPEIRAQRRFNEQISKSQTIEEVKNDIKLRDKNDSTRVLAPLKPAQDAVIIDSTNFTIEEVVNKMLSSIPF